MACPLLSRSERTGDEGDDHGKPYHAAKTAVPSLQLWMNRPTGPGSTSRLAVVEKSPTTGPFSDSCEGLSDQPAPGVYVLRRGRVKLLTTNSDGRTLIVKIAKPVEALGLHSVITGKPYDLTAEMLQPAEVAFIPRADFLKCIAEHGDACMHFANLLSHDCQAVYEV